MFETKELTTVTELDVFLNGGIITGNRLAQTAVEQGKVQGLHNKTLIVDAATITFSDPTEAGLTLLQIATQVRTALSGYIVRWLDGRLIIVNPSAALTLGGAGTANAIFGMPAANVVGVKFAGPEGTAPRWITINAGPRMDCYFVVTEIA